MVREEVGGGGGAVDECEPVGFRLKIYVVMALVRYDIISL